MESRHVPFMPRSVGIGGLRDAWVDAAALARPGRDVPGFLRNYVKPETVLALTRRMMASRDERFLRSVERLVYLMQPSNVWGQRKNVQGLAMLPSNTIVPGRVRKG